MDVAPDTSPREIYDSLLPLLRATDDELELMSDDPSLPSFIKYCAANVRKGNSSVIRDVLNQILATAVKVGNMDADAATDPDPKLTDEVLDAEIDRLYSEIPR